MKTYYVRFIPDNNNDLEGLYKSYGITLDDEYEGLNFGDKVLIRVKDRMIDVYPSRLRIVK